MFFMLLARWLHTSKRFVMMGASCRGFGPDSKSGSGGSPGGFNIVALNSFCIVALLMLPGWY
jgi:hypothetical protein